MLCSSGPRSPFRETPRGNASREPDGKEVASIMIFQKAMMQMSMLALEWDLESFMTNLAEKMKGWGGLAMVILGVAMIIVAVFKAATGLMNHGKGQSPNWLLLLVLFLFGGALCAAGGSGAWNFVFNFAKGGQKTIEGLGSGEAGAFLLAFPKLRCFLG